MLNAELSQVFTKFIAEREYICLSTINQKGEPETRAMLNLGNEKLFPDLRKFYCDGRFAAYFSTNTESDKMSQIAELKTASVYYYDEKTFEGLLFVGDIFAVTDKKTKKEFWQDGWTFFYPDGVEDPTYTLLEFVPKSYKHYDGNGNFHIGDISADKK